MSLPTASQVRKSLLRYISFMVTQEALGSVLATGNHAIKYTINLFSRESLLCKYHRNDRTIFIPHQFSEEFSIGINVLCFGFIHGI